MDYNTEEKYEYIENNIYLIWMGLLGFLMILGICLCTFAFFAT